MERQLPKLAWPSLKTNARASVVKVTAMGTLKGFSGYFGEEFLGYRYLKQITLDLEWDDCYCSIQLGYLGKTFLWIWATESPFPTP